MTTTEPTGPYVYQPFGVQDSHHWASGRLWGVGGVGLPTDVGLATITGLTRMEANAVQAALASEPNEAVMLLYKCYQAGHREGWQDGETTGEVMDQVNDFMCNNFGNKWEQSFKSTNAR